MKKYIFTFTEEQINTIAGALAELPYKAAKPLFDNIISQFQEQQNPPEEAKAEPVAVPEAE